MFLMQPLGLKVANPAGEVFCLGKTLKPICSTTALTLDKRYSLLKTSN